MKKTLANSNPYLRNSSLKKEMLKRFVASSSAIEGIHIKDGGTTSTKESSLKHHKD